VHSPQFSAHVYCCQTAVYIRIPLGTDVGLSLGDIVLDRDTTPPPQKGHSQFSANVRCGQTAEWTKMPLGMEVGLCPGTPTSTRFLVHVYCVAKRLDG